MTTTDPLPEPRAWYVDIPQKAGGGYYVQRAIPEGTESLNWRPLVDRAEARRAALLEAAELVRNYSTAGGVVVFRTEVVNALRERANG